RVVDGGQLDVRRRADRVGGRSGFAEHGRELHRIAGCLGGADQLLRVAPGRSLLEARLERVGRARVAIAERELARAALEVAAPLRTALAYRHAAPRLLRCIPVVDTRGAGYAHCAAHSAYSRCRTGP